jgi:hypothetical protein
MDLIDWGNKGAAVAKQKSETKWANTKNILSSRPSPSENLCKKCYETINI